jgi:hypothetical protein
MAIQPEQHAPGNIVPFARPVDPNLALTYDPHAGQPEPERLQPGIDAGRQGLVSGWVSTGFGLFQLLAPRSFLRLAGMPYPPWLIRAVGARDLALGVGLLARPASDNWRVTRFVNDVLDTGLIGAAAFARSSNRRRLAAFAAVAAGVILLDAWTASAAPPASRRD